MWSSARTWYYDHNRKLETVERSPHEEWVSESKHAHCANDTDLYCKNAHHKPTRGPLAEPPMLDYDTFIEKTLPSDIRFSKLFPNTIK